MTARSAARGIAEEIAPTRQFRANRPATYMELVDCFIWERIGLIVVGLIGFPKTGGVSGTVKRLEVLGGVAASGEVWVMA